MSSRALKAACTVLCAIACSAGGAAESRRVPDTIAERVTPCFACHGAEGRATSEGYFPRIAGKPTGYLFNQLVSFRDGRRNYPLMVYLVEQLTDSYLREIAEYFASLDLPYPGPERTDATREALALGETLAKRGDPGRRMPACSTCHGEALLGVAPYVPGLLGLSRAYIGSQLGYWRNGERRAHAPDCMGSIASQLTPAEVGAVAAWLASQPVPANAKAASSFPGRVPADCGSIPR
jgi:cytochrome c553